jgi:hypothetical protein
MVQYSGGKSLVSKSPWWGFTPSRVRRQSEHLKLGRRRDRTYLHKTQHRSGRCCDSVGRLRTAMEMQTAHNRWCEGQECETTLETVHGSILPRRCRAGSHGDDGIPVAACQDLVEFEPRRLCAELSEPSELHPDAGPEAPPPGRVGSSPADRGLNRSRGGSSHSWGERRGWDSNPHTLARAGFQDRFLSHSDTPPGSLQDGQSGLDDQRIGPASVCYAYHPCGGRGFPPAPAPYPASPLLRHQTPSWIVPRWRSLKASHPDPPPQAHCWRTHLMQLRPLPLLFLMPLSAGACGLVEPQGAVEVRVSNG